MANKMNRGNTSASISKESASMDPEIEGINNVFFALKDLDPDSQVRIMEYVSKKLNLPDLNVTTLVSPPEDLTAEVPAPRTILTQTSLDGGPSDTLEGISPAAKKWILRNGLAANQLTNLFSLGVDEIDLVAKKIPGRGKKEKMRNVFLLKCVASYLSSGVARISQDQLKEAASHYGAYDPTNFARDIKSMASEVSGSKEGGFTLTAKGLTNATELIKHLTNGT